MISDRCACRGRDVSADFHVHLLRCSFTYNTKYLCIVILAYSGKEQGHPWHKGGAAQLLCLRTHIDFEAYLS